MIDKVPKENRKNVGGHLFEELFFEFIEKKYNISQKEFLTIIEEKQNINNSLPISILNTVKLSSLEAIVKFLRENRGLSYIDVGKLLNRNSKTLAVTYAVAHRKMPELFSKDTDNDTKRIPFTAFSKSLSILECICSYLKNSNPENSYADIARMLNKDQRTIWTVCKRAERKSSEKNSSGKIREKTKETKHGK
jgi:hypothetical protein